MEYFYQIVFFIYGVVIGSFLNVCILRIPRKEDIVKGRSHCMCCGYQLKWYDLIPVISYVVLLGRCRKCKAKISLQYPVVEIGNGIFYWFIYRARRDLTESIGFCIIISALLVFVFIKIEKSRKSEKQKNLFHIMAVFLIGTLLYMWLIIR